jgi:hypothetical protein
MTCPDARDQLSALLDDALAVPERQALDAHLAACAECRRELEHLRATVTLLGQLPAARAPAGLADRVLAEAYRPPWPRRLLAALFVPLRVKLPLEAATVLLVGVSALYLHQRVPEMSQLARQEARESSPAPTSAPAAPASETVPTAPVPKLAPGPARSKDKVREVERAPVAPERPPSAVPAPPAPVARPYDVRDAFTAKKEAQVEQGPAAPGTAAPPAGSEKIAQPTEPSAARDAAAAGARAAPSAAAPTPTAPPAGAPAPETRGRVGGIAPAPEGASDALSTAKSGARLMRAVDASGRLTVPAREPAERALDALLGRLGATRVGRLLEGDRGMVVIDVLVPSARYRELIEGLGGIGRWVTDLEPGALPAQVRVEVALTVEP